MFGLGLKGCVLFRESEAPASLLKLLGAGAPSSITPYNDTKALL